MRSRGEALVLPAAILPMSELKSGSGLTGHLNTLDIALAALAYAGPLSGTAGYVAIMIGMGNGLGVPLTFLAVMAVLLLFSVGYGAMTRFVPNPGAFYAYITAGLGRPLGLGSSFIILSSYFAIGIGFYGFAGIAAKQFVEGIGGPVLDWWIYSLIFWAAVASLAYFHVAVSAKVLGILLIAEVVAVFVFDAIAMLHGGHEGIPMQPFTWSAFSSGHLGISLIFGASMFCGFEATAIYREETIDPDRTIPRATVLVVLFIGIFYALASWALITGVGASRVIASAQADPARLFFAVAQQYGGGLFYEITSVLLLTSVFAAHLAIQNVTTRYIFSLAVDGVIPEYFGMAHPRHRSPHRASIAVSALFLVFVATLIYAGLTAEQIYAWFAGLASFTILCAMSITSLATLFYFHRVKVGLSRWSTQFAPALAVLGMLVMVILGIANFPVLIGGSQYLANLMMAAILLLFAAGMALAFWLRGHKPEVYARIGRQ